MKTTIKTFLLFILMSFYANAQEVSYKNIDFKYKKGFLLVNKQNAFKLKHSPGYFYLYDLNTSEEIMYFYINYNDTPDYFNDDYVKVYFTKAKKSFESKSYYKIIMEKLINEKIITPDWHIDEEKLNDFIEKYDENISNRTRR
jgi:hypothetical protein